MKLLLDRFDKDGNGQLDVNEFVGFYAEAKAMYEVVVFLLPCRMQALNIVGPTLSQNHATITAVTVLNTSELCYFWCFVFHVV